MIQLNIHNIFIVIQVINMIILIILFHYITLLIISNKLNIFQHRLFH
jgi:hypothetical protein